MFDKFGEFDSWEELNKAAEGQKEEGDLKALKELAKENGIDVEDAIDYFDGILPELCTPFSAAVGKIEVEKMELNLKEIMEDWANYIIKECSEDEKLTLAVRKKGKRLSGAIGEVLKKSWQIKGDIPNEIAKAAGITGRVQMGIPGYTTTAKILKEYYGG